MKGDLLGCHYYIVLVISVIVLILLMLLFSAVRVVQQYERGVIFVWALIGAKGQAYSGGRFYLNA